MLPRRLGLLLPRGLRGHDRRLVAHRVDAVDARLVCDLDSNGELLTLADGSTVDSDGTTRAAGRICTNAPEKSLLIDRPLANGVDSGYDTIHPINIFPSPDDPTVQAIRGWIEQGAVREDLSPLDFETDVYPILGSNNCGVCHYAGGQADTMDAMQGTFPSIYDGTALEVWTNLTGDGNDIACDAQNNFRVCTNDPDASGLLQNTVNPSNGHISFWTTTDEPDAAILRRWIVEGALFTP